MQGEPIKFICREHGLDHHEVRQWHLRYQKYGEEGLRGTGSYHYTCQEKREIVSLYTEKGLPLQEICLRYNLRLSAVRCWIRKMRKEESLEQRRRGRPPKDPMARPKKKEPQTERCTLYKKLTDSELMPYDVQIAGYLTCLFSTHLLKFEARKYK